MTLNTSPWHSLRRFLVIAPAAQIAVYWFALLAFLDLAFCLFVAFGMRAPNVGVRRAMVRLDFVQVGHHYLPTCSIAMGSEELKHLGGTWGSLFK